MRTPTRFIGIRDLKARTSDVLREVYETGAEVIVTLRGRPVARLEPLTPTPDRPPADGMGGLRGALHDLPPLTWQDFTEAKALWKPRRLADD